MGDAAPARNETGGALPGSCRLAGLPGRGLVPGHTPWLRSRRARGGFTLVELMIVVAIIGILAAIAIPEFSQMVLKARRAEAYPNLKGIATAELAYDAAFDTYIEADSNPGPPLGKELKPWLYDEEGWADLGWAPDGWVRCTYMVSVISGGTQFRADSDCDVDDDNRSAIIRYYSGEGVEAGYFYDLYPDRY